MSTVEQVQAAREAQRQIAQTQSGMFVPLDGFHDREVMDELQEQMKEKLRQKERSRSLDRGIEHQPVDHDTTFSMPNYERAKNGTLPLFTVY